jgi:hypothetical protein
MDLSKFMFRHAVPVSTFDIEELVNGAMNERQRYRAPQASIIDKLIEEALLEFTSLTDDKAPASTGTRAAAPLLIGGSLSSQEYLGRAVSWIDEIAVGQKRDPGALHSSLPPGVTEGNLAALEDEPSIVSVRPLRGPASYAPAGPQTPVAEAEPPPPPPPGPLASADSGRSARAATRMGVVVALVLVTAAGAAAWFSHVIPHP